VEERGRGGEGELSRTVKTGRKEIGPAEPFWAERGAGPRVLVGRGLEKKEKGRERGLERFLFFLFFKPFQTFKIKLFSKFKHFKPFSKFSKQFKNF
jgi:hypothetical protein